MDFLSSRPQPEHIPACRGLAGRKGTTELLLVGGWGVGVEPGLAPLQSHPDPLSLRGCRGAEGGTETGSEAQKQGHRDTERDKERPTCVDTGAETGHESDGKAEEDTQLETETERG